MAGADVSTTVRVDFLTRPALTSTTSRSDGLEWPPHPLRLFAALTAAHYEAGVGRRATLEWLENLPAPEVAAAELEERDGGTFYVPVNDALDFTGQAVDRALGDCRSRQSRSFVTAALPISSVERSIFYSWQSREPAPDDLDAILREVTRLGHSSSLVTASLSATPPPAALVHWRPAQLDEAADLDLRVPCAGSLDRLDRAEAARRKSRELDDRRRLEAEPPAIPYRRVVPEGPASPWSERWLFRLTPKVSVRVWLELAEAIRGRLLTLLGKEAPPVLTGHSLGNHLALLPLVEAGHSYSSGQVLGLAVVTPALEPGERELLLAALAGLDDADDPAPIRCRLGVFRANGVDALDRSSTLNWQATWKGPARTWATVTPMIFDRFPKSRLGREEIVADAVEKIGLPRPEWIFLTWDAPFQGVPHSPEFRVRRGPRPGGPIDHRLWSHVVLSFDEKVSGPLVIGAGRHFGLGFFRPGKFVKRPAAEATPAEEGA